MSSPRPRILLIDDTPANLDLLLAALSADFDMQISTSGAQGLGYAAQTKPDLLLLDVMMPEMDGFEVFRRFKEHARLRDVPIIFLTALGDAHSEGIGLELGAADYIAKPINVAIAQRRIRNLLEREALHKVIQSQFDELKQATELLQALRQRELALHTEQVREQERKNVAREIHDELGQVLTGLRLHLMVMDVRYCSVDPALPKLVADMKGLLDQGMRSVRDVVKKLRPAALELGLRSALESLCNESASSSGINFIVKLADCDCASDDMRSAFVYRIAQESITNAIRHSRASTISVALRCDHEWALEVGDNGIGFEVEPGKRRTSFGLLGMHERAVALGGKLEIESTLQQGSTLRLTIPETTCSE